jgi:ribosomal protein S18 acetylase RimI-like enzyme
VSRVIRPARSTDAGKLGAILSEAVRAHTWKPQLHTGDRGWVRVCESDGVVAGFLALDGTSVQSLYVSVAEQGKGIGGALLVQAQEGQERLELWTFQANEDAQRFYRAHGFTAAERKEGAGNEEGLPDVRFTWVKSNKEPQNG